MYRLLHSITSSPNLLNTYHRDDNTPSRIESYKTNQSLHYRFFSQPFRFFRPTNQPSFEPWHPPNIACPPPPNTRPKRQRHNRYQNNRENRNTDVSACGCIFHLWTAAAFVSAARRWKLGRPNLGGVRACQGDRHDRVKTRRASVGSRYGVAFEPWMRIIATRPRAETRAF